MLSSRSEETVQELLAKLATELTPEAAAEVLEGLTVIATGDAPETDDASHLKELYEAYNDRHEFGPGQLVTWKLGLRNKRLPEYGAPGIVVEVLETPAVNDAEDPASPYFRERLELAVGVVDEEGDFVVVHCDGARLEPFDVVS